MVDIRDKVIIRVIRIHPLGTLMNPFYSLTLLWRGDNGYDIKNSCRILNTGMQL